MAPGGASGNAYSGRVTVFEAATLPNSELKDMTKMRNAILLTIVALGMICGTSTQKAMAQRSDAEIQKEILAVDQERYDAMQKRDIAAMDRLHADGLVFINTKGRMLNKAEYIDEIKSGALKFLSVEIDDYHWGMYGDTVIMNGRAKSVVEYHGVVNKKPRRFTSVFIKMDGRWRLVAHQATIIADE
jgi:ketosteroid isomerase-like protein